MLSIVKLQDICRNIKVCKSLTEQTSCTNITMLTFCLLGDVLQLEVERPWEFNSTYPIRSIVMPYVVCGPGFYILRWLRDIGVFTESLAPPSEWILIAPRLFVLATSLVMDILMMKIAGNLSVDVTSTLWCYSTSYILFVYFTRTFTNTFEAFIFIGLLYYCTKNRRSSQPTDIIWIALLLTAGIFNRPTFPAFAIAPLIFWVRNDRSMTVLITRTFQCMVFTGIFSTFFVLFDTLYFRNITLNELIMVHASDQSEFSLSTLAKNFVLTPLNFILYNTESSNLAEHGLHPRITHFVVNLPMLFGPGAVAIYYFIVKMPISIINGTARQIELFLLAAILLPVTILSVFPHQEARFLVPLVAPFCLLCSAKLFKAHNFSWKFLRAKWLIFNVFGAVVFGCLHQGGVIRSFSHLQKHLNGLNVTCGPYEYHIIYYHTYMPPRHLLGQPTHWPPTYDDQPISKMIHIHDLKGAPIGNLVKNIKNLSSNNTKLILVTPTTVTQKICRSKKNQFGSYTVSVATHII